MAAKQPPPTPRYCIQHSRFTKPDGWRLRDLSLSLNGNIALTGCNENTDRTYIDVYTNVRHSDSRDKPKIIYSKEFEKYSDEKRIYLNRRLSFIDDDVLVSCLGDKLEVFQVNKDEVLRSRRVNGEAFSLSVRERRGIFVGFWKSNKITVYDVIDLNEIKSIILQGIQDGCWPFDMTAIADRIFVCVVGGSSTEESNDKSLVFEEKNGRILSELTKPTDTVQWYVQGLALNITLNVIAVAWSQKYGGRRKGKDVIVFYSLLSENNCSFLIVEIEFGICRIRISDRGDRMITRDRGTQECKVFDVAELFTYHHLKENLKSQLQTDDCIRLTNYFALPKDQLDAISKSETPIEDLLLALDERGVIQPSNVDRLIEAFSELKISSCCYYLVDFFKTTRKQTNLYDRFLATLSAHLTASLPGELCNSFTIFGKDKNSITSSQNPGLSLLLALDEMGVITQGKVEALEQPFTEMQLVQAVAKIHEYQSIVQEEKSRSISEVDGKRELFIRCLQNKIKSWYETMTPVPWKKSCRWKSKELFVGSGLVLTDSKAKRSLADIDEQCKLQYTQVFTHERLKSETRLVLKGDPGSGKTMLASQLAYDWSQGKISEIDILILLPLKFVGNKTLIQSIWQLYVPENKDLSVVDIEESIKDEGNKCCFILDGLEEYSGGGDPSEVMKVMTKTKYPNSKVLITSRSDFAQDLPSCPLLKLGRFGEKERNAYIEKVFPGDVDKQLEVKNIVEDNSFILDLCSVPVLFVLAVHNIEGMGKMEKRNFDRVSPFMDSMVKTLCPSYSSKTDSLTEEGTSLEEVAYNGLCRGLQQLSWQKEFIEQCVGKSRQWLDSGILVVDDSNAALMGRKDQEQTMPADAHVSKHVKDSAPVQEETQTMSSGVRLHPSSTAPQDSESVQGTTPVVPSVSSKKKPSALQHMFQLIRKRSKVKGPTAETVRKEAALPDPVSEASNASPLEAESQVRTGEAEKSGPVAEHVSLQVKFLHKIIQEWFAARHFSHMVSNLQSLNAEQQYLSESLTFINRADLHYVLRFSCALYPPCCHYIIKHLLNNYSLEQGSIPEHIMNCAFLCFAEFDDLPGSEILEAVRMICKENITIQSEDSRLLQQAKVSLMTLASDARIMIRKAILVDLVISATKEFLIFSSGVTMKALGTLKVIEISRWDQTLKDRDYLDIVKFIANCPILLEATMHFPAPPPEVDKQTLIDLASSSKTVTWMIGPRVSQTLDTETGEWQEMTFENGLPQCTVTKLTDRGKNQGAHSWHEKNTFDAEAVISREGGNLFIPNTGVKLYIPPNAFEDDIDQCLLQMRIILPGTFDEPATSFTTNTSTVVELLPNNLKLKQTVILTLPHCLDLEVDRRDGSYTAKIFISHHERGTLPVWEEQPHLLYYLDDTKCSIWLESFCWVKVQVNGVTVKGKKIQVYTAGKELVHGDDIVELEVGYYPDLPAGGEILRNNKNLILLLQKPFIFVKKGKIPLTLSLQKVVPSSWKPIDVSQEIPFQCIADSEERSCPFVFENENKGPSFPVFIFRISQGDRGFRLSTRPPLKGMKI